MKKLMIVILVSCISGAILTGQEKAGALEQPNLFLPERFEKIPHVRDLAFSLDGNEIYFTVQDFKKQRSFLATMQKKGNQWGEISILPFSGKYNDIEPFVSPDGNRLYFASNRPVHVDSVQPKDYDIWYVEKKEGSWSVPKNIGEPVNSPTNEFFPAITNSGNLYFTAQYEDSKGKEDIYVCRWDGEKYLEPVNLGDSINTLLFEFNAYVSPDEEIIIYTSYGRNGSIGGGDLYYTTRNKDDQWDRARMFPVPVNSKSLDFCPFYSVVSKDLYFTSDRIKRENNHEKRTDFDEFIKECNTYPNGQSRIFKVNIQDLLIGWE